MDYLKAINKLLPNWNGAVWGNSYEGIKPDVSETRPTPTLAELEAVWPEIEAEELKEKTNAEVMTKLELIDKQSIRGIREWIALQPTAEKFTKDLELEAATERAKIQK